MKFEKVIYITYPYTKDMLISEKIELKKVQTDIIKHKNDNERYRKEY